MRKYTIDEFVNKTAEKEESGEELFDLENDYTLYVNLNGKVWVKLGSMIAYAGDIRFKKQSSLEGGVSKFLKKAVTGEGAHMMAAEGYGNLYLADDGKRIAILNLENERIYVNGNDVIAFEESIDWDITMAKGSGSSLTGKLFTMKLQGSGMVAITTHYTPMTLIVTPDRPVYTDPNATVAWSGNLAPEIKTDISFKSITGRGSGEEFQMKFQGDGFVVVQPFEEVYKVE
ncbi:AIM24 family protein [Methanobacterium alcaliphilum]|uniref:AIM24 family protein n=1 Tax=Methanobacterium alcaliphilum TaxID=392018 RepID=UPI002009E574|nr:AIM24 family protein [Methanobacterium alcaliphilum]MCK9151939.1 AIM24 family protein [Methanobacterium alcaliphilum]